MRPPSPGRARAAPAAAVLLLCLVPGGWSAAEYSSSELSTFVDTMLAEYDRETPPAPRTPVALALDVRHASVDDAAGTMRVLADLRMSWNESRLSWNTSEWGDVVVVPAGRLWAPALRLASAGASWPGGPQRARLGAGGAARLLRRLELAAPVPLHLRAWPADSHEASFKFISDHDEIELLVTEYKHSVIVESGAWEVTLVEGRVEAGAGEEGAQLAAWRVAARRRGAARAAAAGAALAGAGAALLAAAAAPPAHRSLLAAAAAFLAALWLMCAAAQMPSGSGAPAAVRAAGGLCGAGAGAAAAAALAGRLRARTPPAPAALQRLLAAVSTVYTLTPDTECGAGGGWAAAAQLVDALAVALLLAAAAVLLALYCFS